MQWDPGLLYATYKGEEYVPPPPAASKPAVPKWAWWVAGGAVLYFLVK